MAKLGADPGFIPYVPRSGDEMLGDFPFRWNVKWIEENLEDMALSVMQVQVEVEKRMRAAERGWP